MEDRGIEPEPALNAVVHRIRSTYEAVGNAFPYFADPDTGKWTTTPNGNWCGGHWIGLLRLASQHLSGEASRQLEVAADERTNEMVEYMPNNTMFRGMNFLYAGFEGYDRTGERGLFGLGLSGADAMIECYNERARQIPLGELSIQGPEEFRGPESDQGPHGSRIGAVDNVYTTLPVLWRAYEETDDPRFRDIAISHADRHLDWYLKGDGSTWHHAVYDSETGELEYQYNELAYSDDTCWARGQGWNIAGLCRAYLETGSERYLNGLRRSVEYYRDNSPPNEISYWDLEVSGADEPRDTSAAALVAYGLCQLDADDDSVTELYSYGEEVLRRLLDDYLVTDQSATNYGAVLEGCFNRPSEYAMNNELIWTNYYLARAIESYLNK